MCRPAAAGYFILMHIVEKVVVSVFEGIGKAIVTLIQVIIVGIINSLTRGIRRGGSPRFIQPTNVGNFSHHTNTQGKARTGKILLVHMLSDKIHGCTVMCVCLTRL